MVNFRIDDTSIRTMDVGPAFNDLDIRRINVRHSSLSDKATSRQRRKNFGRQISVVKTNQNAPPCLSATLSIFIKIKTKFFLINFWLCKDFVFMPN